MMHNRKNTKLAALKKNLLPRVAAVVLSSAFSNFPNFPESFHSETLDRTSRKWHRYGMAWRTTWSALRHTRDTLRGGQITWPVQTCQAQINRSKT